MQQPTSHTIYGTFFKYGDYNPKIKCVYLKPVDLRSRQIGIDIFAPHPAVKLRIPSESFKRKIPHWLFTVTGLLVVSYTMSNNGFLEKTSLNDIRNNINHKGVYLSLHLSTNIVFPHSDFVRTVYTERKPQSHYYKCPKEKVTT